jgi:hypothetical protein
MRAQDGRSMRERMLAGDLYLADDRELAGSTTCGRWS